METWDAISARRNVRSYTSQPVGQPELDRRPFQDVVHYGRW